MNTYKKGLNFELEVKRLLEDNNYFVVHSAGSRGPVDLVAFWNSLVYFIQCKCNHRIPLHTTDNLIEVARRHNAVPAYAKREKGKTVLINLTTHQIILEKRAA
jgi:Holliday junction resolvase